MQHELFLESDFILKVFDSLPSALFIVDSEVRIHHLNSAAASTFGLDGEKVYLQRGGEVLHCMHSTDNPAGCGFTEYCKDCLIRNSVRSALENNKMYREKTRMEILDDGKKSEIDLVVTASPFTYKEESFILLTLEDTTELNQLRGLLPICSNCKSIRNDDRYWESVEKYFSSHHDVKFTHGICPKCAQEFYSSFEKK
jgi:PAS domain-containing protein